MQSSVTHLHDDPKGLKGEFGNDFALEERIEESKDDEEDQGDNGAGFELEERKVAGGFFEGGLDAIHLLGLGFLGADFGGVFCFHGLEFFGGFVDGGFEGFVGVGAVN